MILLAVETSGMSGSIALLDDTGTITERTPPSEGRRNAQSLIADIDTLLREHGWAPADVDAVAVSIGPGSFTGLRVGLTFAKTFAWINNSALIAVDTLQALAQQVDAEHPVVAAVIDAQRGELFWNEYAIDPGNGIRTARHEVALIKPDQLAPLIPITGPGLMKHAEQLRETHRLLDTTFWQPKAATVAQIAAAHLAAHQTSDPITLEPIYIRRSYAEEKRA